MNDTQNEPANARSATGNSLEAYMQRSFERWEEQDAVPGSVKGPPKVGRPRRLPSIVLWTTVIRCVLLHVKGVQDVWRALVLQGYAISDQTVYDRLEQEGTAPLEQFFGQLTRLLAAWLTPLVSQQSWWQSLAPFASDILALDETTLDPVARILPQLRRVKKGAVDLLPGKLAGLFDVRLQLWRRMDYLPEALQNCKVHARAMLCGVVQGTLLLFDLGYFGFEWLDELTAQHYWSISRLREKTSYAIIHTYYEAAGVFDGLVWLGTGRARAASAVRLVYWQVGAIQVTYVTNVLSPTQLCLQDIAVLYGRRWDIELAFLTLKEHLGMHLWWSSKVSGLLQQVWACLIIAQFLQAMRLEIACRADVDPFEVSLPLLIRTLPTVQAYEGDVITVCVQRGRQLGLIRPSSRTHFQAPLIPEHALKPLPASVSLQRPAAYPVSPGQPGRNSHKKKERGWVPEQLTPELYALLEQ
jgi:hypothetical protein